MKAIVLFNRNLGENEMLNFKKYAEYFKENQVDLDIKYANTEDEIIEAAKGYDIVLDMMQPMTTKIIENLDCKALIRAGIGVSNYDVEACTRKGILLCNSPTHCVKEVAVLTVAHIFKAVTLLSEYVEELRRGEATAFRPPRRLSCMKVGLIGFGRIARLVADILLGAGCTILAYDPYLSKEVIESVGAQKVELDSLLAESDIISMHVPLFPSTKHIINAQAFEKMKDGVILVNTGRGGLIDQNALMEALKSGKVGAAGLDVVEYEPAVINAKDLIALPNVFCTPHVGYRGVEALDELEEVAATMIVEVATGKIPRNVVNRKELGL